MNLFLVYVCLDKANCNKQWGICLCGNQRKKFVMKAQITRHYQKCHAVKGKKPSSKALGTNQVNSDLGVELSNDTQTINVSPDLGNIYDDGFLTQGAGSDTAAEENSLDWKQVVNREQLGFASNWSYQYFQQCFITKSLVSCADYLVKRSSFDKALTANDLRNRLETSSWPHGISNATCPIMFWHVYKTAGVAWLCSWRLLQNWCRRWLCLCGRSSVWGVWLLAVRTETKRALFKPIHQTQNCKRILCILDCSISLYLEHKSSSISKCNSKPDYGRSIRNCWQSTYFNHHEGH